MRATRSIDFAALSLQDALDLAVLIEEEARDRYQEFADQMEIHHTPEAARFFRYMADNEEKHRSTLVARRRARFGDATPAVTRTMLFDVEAPDYDEARAFMTARAALETALRCEQKAEAFFAAALPQLGAADVRALFDELRREEIEHQALIRRQLADAPPDPLLGGDDFADEPVGQ
ncbi:MAG TPA: ferritin family protein [Candidatus Binatia bacterium]|jgi:rubrerythrin